jgi:hypothetical protein
VGLKHRFWLKGLLLTVSLSKDVALAAESNGLISPHWSLNCFHRSGVKAVDLPDLEDETSNEREANRHAVPIDNLRLRDRDAGSIRRA